MRQNQIDPVASSGAFNNLTSPVQVNQDIVIELSERTETRGDDCEERDTMKGDGPAAIRNDNRSSRPGRF